MYHSQVYHADFDAAALALDALQFFAFQVGQLAVEVVGFADFCFQFIKIVRFQLVAAYLQQIADVFGYVCKFSFLNGIQRLEVIVYVLQARFAKTTYAVHQFAGKVVALIVIESFFQYGIVVEAAHGKCSGTLHLLDELFLEFY